MKNSTIDLSCPLPITTSKKILLGHGSGGKLSAKLLDDLILPFFKNSHSSANHDGAVLSLDKNRIAFTTDSYVVQPIFFPGGNIGDLAVNGTVNDLAMCGAIPAYLSLGLIIEEGLYIDELTIILQTISDAAKKANVEIITGDTKVVEKGKCDKLFINTSGIGKVNSSTHIHPKRIKPGQVIIINGTIADHGMAVLSARENLSFETHILSDTVPLNYLVQSVLTIYPELPMMRDVTRGGLGSILNEIAESSGCRIEIDEEKIPIKEEVSAFCELLGFDPLYVANEGKCIFFVDPDQAEKVLAEIRKNEYGLDSQIIGKVSSHSEEPKVIVKTKFGSKRILDRLPGDQLPRIC